MYRDKKRYGQDAQTVVRSKPPTFNAPLNKLKGPLVFTCSWSDFFIDVADPWRTDAWDIIRRTPHLTYQILTKRPERIANHLPPDWENGWPNVWLGVSVETSEYLWRIDVLKNIPSAVKFVSYEPALEYIDFKPYADTVDWLISGGESGGRYRPADIEWFRQVQDDCARTNILYFHKQHGGSGKTNGSWGGCEIEGKEYKEIPLRCRS
jgi:protein gp37